MNTHEEILQRLGELSQSDRTWIIGRLSPSARGNLLNGVAYDSSPAALAPVTGSEVSQAQATTHSARNRDVLSQASVHALARILTDEPAWLVSVALSRPRPSNSEVMALLPSQLRSEVESLQRRNVAYAEKLIDCVERGLVAALDSTPVDPPSSRFGGWFSSIGARISQSRVRLGK